MNKATLDKKTQAKMKEIVKLLDKKESIPQTKEEEFRDIFWDISNERHEEMSVIKGIMNLFLVLTVPGNYEIGADGSDSLMAVVNDCIRRLERIEKLNDNLWEKYKETREDREKLFPLEKEGDKDNETDKKKQHSIK